MILVAVADDLLLPGTPTSSSSWLSCRAGTEVASFLAQVSLQVKALPQCLHRGVPGEGSPPAAWPPFAVWGRGCRDRDFVQGTAEMGAASATTQLCLLDSGSSRSPLCSSSPSLNIDGASLKYYNSIPGTGESAENRKARLLPARCSQSKAENKCPKAAPALTHAAKGRWKDRRTAQGAGRSHRMPALSGGGG